MVYQEVEKIEKEIVRQSDLNLEPQTAYVNLIGVSDSPHQLFHYRLFILDWYILPNIHI